MRQKDLDATRLTHQQQAVAVFINAEGESVTSDGTLHFWNSWSRGTYEMVVTRPASILKPIGVPAKARYMPLDNATFVTYVAKPGANKLIIQGWKKVDRTYSLTPPLSLEHLAREAVSDGFWPFVINSDLHLFDVETGTKRVVRFGATYKPSDVIRVCKSSGVALMRYGDVASIWDVSSAEGRRLRFDLPQALATARVMVLLCEQERIVFADGNALSSWSIKTDEKRSVDLRYVPQSLAIVGKSENVLVLGANGEVSPIDFDLRQLARGTVTLNRERDGLGGKMVSSCVSKGRMVLLLSYNDWRSNATYELHSFAIESDKILFAAAVDIEDAWSAVFGTSCKLMAHVGYRTRKGGIFDAWAMKPILDIEFEEAEYWAIDYVEAHRRAVLLGASLYDLNMDEDLARVLRSERKLLKACLTPQERASFQLQPEPPRWCITGPGRELQREKSEWVGVPPFDTPQWKDWLLGQQGKE
jgi:hypothetical protein